MEATESEEGAGVFADTDGSTQAATYVSAYMQGSVGEPSPDFDQRRQEFVTQEQFLESEEQERQIWAEATVEANNLVKVIESSQVSLKQKIPTLKLIDPRNVKWSEVEQAITQGLKYYQEESLKGPKGWVRKAFRKLSENSKAFEKWIAFLPEGSMYTAPVCASFRIILAVAGGISEIRDEVFSTLAEIPEIFKSVEEYLHIYDSVALRTCAAALYASLARTLQTIMKFFSENPLKKVGKAILKFENYNASLKSNLQQMHTCRAAFRDAGELCLHRSIRNIGKSMQNMSTSVTQVQELFLERYGKEPNKQEKESENLEEEQLVKLSNALYATLKEVRSCFYEDMINFKRQHGQKLLLANGPNRGLKRRRVIELLLTLGFDPTANEKELETAFLEGVNRNARSWERLTWIKETREFQDWILDTSSRYLFIQSDDRNPQPTSAFSILGAEIAHILAVADMATIAIHFCGFHNRPSSEEHAGGTGMIINVLGQILSSWNPSWDEPYIDKQLKKDLESAKLKALSKALKSTIQSLKSGQMMFVFIDSVDAFEHPALVKKAIRSFECLFDILNATNKDGGIVMKLLMTAPNQRWFSSVVEDFDHGEILTIPEVTDCGLSSTDRSGILELAVSQLAER